MDKKHIKSEYQLGWKDLRDMARKGIGHSKLQRVSDAVKEKQKKKKKK